MPEFTELLSALQIGAHTVKNRIVSSAHGEQMGVGGRITQQLIDYHVRRAEGGAGMLVVFGSGTVHPASNNAGNISLWDPENEPALRELASRVRAEGAVLLAQGSHRGVREAPTALDGYSAAPSPTAGPLPLGAAHVLSVEDIDQIVADYGSSAARLARCGFSGIELTGLGSHLMELFWSPVTNVRDDAYGGSFHNRMRLTREIVQRVADRVPDDFLISFRLSGDPQTAALGLDEEAMREIAAHIDALGRIDTFSVSAGSGANISTHAGNVPTDAFPLSPYSRLAKGVRDLVSVPVTVAGRVLTADAGEEVLASGSADLVAMTRALIADPDLPKHIAAGEPELARPCIAINEGCRRVIAGGRLACTVNPAVGDPLLGRLVPALRQQRVAVVGGGPGGMEAARVAAMRGHAVTLFDEGTELGGQVNVAALDEDRPSLGRHVAWLRSELQRHGVDVRLGARIGASHVADGFDRVVIATGARAVTPPGIDRNALSVATDIETVFDRTVDPGDRRVIVYDAQSHRRGASAAVKIAERHGSEVLLATHALQPMASLEDPNKPPLLRRIAATGVRVLTGHDLVVDAEGTVRIEHLWSDEHLHVGDGDLLVTVGWTSVDTSLLDDLKRTLPAAVLHVVGDAFAPRLMRNAISEGARVGALV